MDEAAMHGLAGDIVRFLEPHTESDPAGLLLQLLAGVGSLVGSGVYFLVEATPQPARHFIVLVGQTSKARKGTSWRLVERILSSADDDWPGPASGLSSGEGLIWAVRDPTVDKSRAVDTGGGDKQLLVTEGEFARTLRVLGRDTNTLSAIIRQAWDDGNLRVLNKNSPVQVLEAHISIIGHISRDELVSNLSAIEMGNGFANRFLWVAVGRSKFLPEGGNIDAFDSSSMSRRLGDAIKEARGRGRICFDEETRQVWHEVYCELSADRPGLTGGILARAEAHVVRLALTYAILDASDAIRREHLEAALAVWEYCERSVGWIFGEKTGNRNADRILTELRLRPGGMTRTEIRNLFGNNRGKSEVDKAVSLLMALGRASAESEKTGGRDATRYRAT